MTELAETCLAAGEFEQGLQMIAEARAICATTGNRYHAADVHRVKGELLIASVPGNRIEGEQSLLNALDIAQQHGARALELRALTSLVRLDLKTPRAVKWRTRLERTRGLFTEGRDTVDIRRADEVLARA